MKNTVFGGLLLLFCMSVSAQNLPSGEWMADARSLALGGALSVARLHPLLYPSAGGQRLRADVSLSGALPYMLPQWGRMALGGCVGWKNFAVGLNGGFCGSGEGYVSLLWGHQLGGAVRYVAGGALYLAPGREEIRLCAPMLQAGLLLTPLERWRFFLWVSNPSLTRVGETSFATDIRLGALLDAGPLLRVTGELDKVLGQPLYARLGLERTLRPLPGRDWRPDLRLGVRCPDPCVSCGLGLTHAAGRRWSVDAAACFDFSAGCSLSASVTVGLDQ